MDVKSRIVKFFLFVESIKEKKGEEEAIIWALCEIFESFDVGYKRDVDAFFLFNIERASWKVLNIFVLKGVEFKRIFPKVIDNPISQFYHIDFFGNNCERNLFRFFMRGGWSIIFDVIQMVLQYFFDLFARNSQPSGHICRRKSWFYIFLSFVRFDLLLFDIIDSILLGGDRERVIVITAARTAGTKRRIRWDALEYLGHLIIIFLFGS